MLGCLDSREISTLIVINVWLRLFKEDLLVNYSLEMGHVGSVWLFVKSLSEAHLVETGKHGVWELATSAGFTVVSVNVVLSVGHWFLVYLIWQNILSIDSSGNTWLSSTRSKRRLLYAKWLGSWVCAILASNLIHTRLLFLDSRVLYLIHRITHKIALTNHAWPLCRHL